MKSITENNVSFNTNTTSNTFNNTNSKTIINSLFFKKYYPYISIIAADFVAIIISFFLQFYLRFHTNLFIESSFNNSSFVYNEFTYAILGALFVYFYWSFLFFLSGLYKNWYENSPFEEFYLILKTVIFGSLIFYVIIISDTSKSMRLLILYHSIFLMVLSVLLRFISRNFYQFLLKSKTIFFNTIVFGIEDNIKKIVNQTKLSPAWGYEVINTIDIEKLNKLNKTEIYNYLDELLINTEVIIISNIKNIEQYTNIDFIDIVNYIADKNIRIKIENNLYDTFIGTVKNNTIYGIPFIEINPQILKPWQTFAKRAFDIVFSLAVIIIGLPIWLLVALIIALESKGGVFYTQPRYGKDGKVFQIFKFRSMRQNTDKQSFWTIKNDSRVTTFGRFIRKTHLDEIPQFVNVLIGDMSVVGPRPEQPRIADVYHEKMPIFKRRLKVRPGITGWWQIKYVNSEITDEEMESRLKDDFYYIENLSLKFDFEIIIRTVWCVIKGHGQA